MSDENIDEINKKRKRRTVTHEMEEKSVSLIRSILPSQWVVRDYKPDYGIDLAIEIFDPTDSSDGVSETLGAFFFAQVKSTKDVTKVISKKKNRYNVEKEAKIDNSSRDTDVEVIKFIIDVALLNTVEIMGPVNAVMLFIVDLSTNLVYFLCLNDYIEKVLRWEHHKYDRQGSVQIEIPTTNVIGIDNKCGIKILRLYAMRPKYYAAFAKFYYQRHELNYNASPERIVHFLNIIKRFDVWNATDTWEAFKLIKIYVDKLYDDVCSDRYKEAFNKLDRFGNYTGDMRTDSGRSEVLLIMSPISLYDQLCNLQRVYEEVVREWFLPTAMAHDLSSQ